MSSYSLFCLDLIKELSAAEANLPAADDPVMVGGVCGEFPLKQITLK